MRHKKKVRADKDGGGGGVREKSFETGEALILCFSIMSEKIKSSLDTAEPKTSAPRLLFEAFSATQIRPTSLLLLSFR